MKLITDYGIVKNKKRLALFLCERCNNELEYDIYTHNRRIKINKLFCPKCTNEIKIENGRDVFSKPDYINGVKILEHYKINPKGSKRYMKVECPMCKKHYDKRHDALKNHPLCKQCGDVKGAITNTTHGLSSHNLFQRWFGIIERCHNKKANAYNYYGEKGITMCNEWRNDFKTFYDWSISNGYSKELEIDKDILCDAKNISPKIYSPETCMWITKERNRDYARAINT